MKLTQITYDIKDNPILHRSLIPSLAYLGLSITTSALTIVLDFNDPTQGNTTDQYYDYQVETFNIMQYGFEETDRNAIYDSILNGVKNDYDFDLGIA